MIVLNYLPEIFHVPLHKVREYLNERDSNKVYAKL